MTGFLPTLCKRLLWLRCQQNKMAPHSECKWNQWSLKLSSWCPKAPHRVTLNGNTSLIATISSVVIEKAIASRYVINMVIMTLVCAVEHLWRKEQRLLLILTVWNHQLRCRQTVQFKYDRTIACDTLCYIIMAFTYHPSYVHLAEFEFSAESEWLELIYRVAQKK